MSVKVQMTDDCVIDLKHAIHALSYEVSSIHDKSDRDHVAEKVHDVILMYNDIAEHHESMIQAIDTLDASKL